MGYNYSLKPYQYADAPITVAQSASLQGTLFINGGTNGLDPVVCVMTSAQLNNLSSGNVDCYSQVSAEFSNNGNPGFGTTYWHVSVNLGPGTRHFVVYNGSGSEPLSLGVSIQIAVTYA